MANIWIKKPMEAYEADIKKSELKRVLGKWSLTAIGIGAIIGGGIFVLTGTGAYYHAGPALALSFVIAGIACVFAALCYAEFASILPVEGSAYAYAYGTVGEVFAWIIGWGLILEYAMGSMTVAVSWSGYFAKFLTMFGIHLPNWLTTDPQTFAAAGGTGFSMNLPALLIALGFEFVNGFHDTANAVATVIYTHSLPAQFAVVWSGCWNFLGVLLSSGAVAFGIIALLPVELILQVGSAAGFAMVFALLLAAIIWNLGTW